MEGDGVRVQQVGPRSADDRVAWGPLAPGAPGTICLPPLFCFLDALPVLVDSSRLVRLLLEVDVLVLRVLLLGAVRSRSSPVVECLLHALASQRVQPLLVELLHCRSRLCRSWA